MMCQDVSLRNWGIAVVEIRSLGGVSKHNLPLENAALVASSASRIRFEVENVPEQAVHGLSAQPRYA